MRLKPFSDARDSAFVGIWRGMRRWKTRTSSNRNTPMREPSRSVISAPSAINKASISDHRIEPLAGRAKMS
jgi:hypothetical protein